MTSTRLALSQWEADARMLSLVLQESTHLAERAAKALESSRGEVERPRDRVLDPLGPISGRDQMILDVSSALRRLPDPTIAHIRAIVLELLRGRR